MKILIAGGNGQLGSELKKILQSRQSNLYAMEMGELLAYKKLRERGLINQSRYLVCCTYSYLKYLRRKVTF